MRKGNTISAIKKTFPQKHLVGTGILGTFATVTSK
jgi:hypothetical protein